MLLLSLATAAAVFGATRLDFMQKLESSTLDLRFRLQPTAADARVIIVAVDGSSLERISWVGWPWPRQMYADCIGLLRRWGARVVAFDIIYADPSQYGAFDDFALRDSSAAFGGTVFALSLSRGGGVSSDPVPTRAVIPLAGDTGGLDSAWSCEAPHDSLLPGAGAFGNVSAPPDPDGVYRRVGVFTDTPAGPVPSLAMSAAWLAAGRPELSLEPDRLVFGDAEIPLDGEYGMMLRFRGPTATFRYVPVADLLEAVQARWTGAPSPVDSTIFRDAIVFFGYTAAGLYDLKPTPYSGVCPGVEVHATAVDNILSGTALRRPGPVAVLAATLLMSILCGMVFLLRRAVLVQVLLGTAVLAVFAVASFLLFSADIWLESVSPLSAGLLSLLGGSILSYSRANRQRREIRAAFSQYLSPAVVEQLSRHPERLRLGGEQREMTVYFSDLAGFTTFSEKLTPEELVHLLNRYLTLMTDTVLSFGGTLDKYIGDAIVAFWNAPLECADHAATACRTVLEMRMSLAGLNALLAAEGLPELKPRTGLNTGLMTVGNMGSSRRFDYTVMGSSVNLASRLEGVNKYYGTMIMASKATVAAAGPGFVFRELDTIRVVGQVTPVNIFELLGYEGMVEQPVLGRAASYAVALAAYRAGDFTRASALFASLADDPPSSVMRRRCEGMQAEGAPGGWDGVWDMTSK